MHPVKQREAFPVGSVEDICLFPVALSWWLRVALKNTNPVWSPFYVTFNWQWWWLSLKKMSLALLYWTYYLHATNVCVKVINVFNKISPELFDPDEVWFSTLKEQVVLLLSYPVHCSVLSLYKSTFPSSPAEWVVSHTAHYQVLYRCISPAQKIICHINERINLSGHALFFPLNQITCVYPRLFSVIISYLMVSND